MIDKMNFQWSERSKKELDTVHVLLRETANICLMYTKVDFGISEGHRSPERQKQLLKEGKTKVEVSKHNANPSNAFDIFIANGYTFDVNHVVYVAGVMQVSFELAKHRLNLEKYELRWGGNWDNDGVIIKDQNFQDLVHFELELK